MHIVSVTDSLVVGGGGRVMETLARMSASYGLRSSVIGFSGDDDYVKSLNNTGVEASVLSKEELVDFIHEDCVVIYHSSGAHRQDHLDILAAVKHESKPYIMMERSVFGHVDGMADEIFDKVLCNSLHTMWRIKERLNGDFQSHRYELMYNPVDVELFSSNISKAEARKEFGIPRDAFVIGDACRPAPEKVSIKLLRVSAELAKVIPNLYVVTRRYPEAMAKKLDNLLGDRYINLPFEKNIGKTPFFYKALDAFVHFSTMGESFGMANAEAMLSGVPIVVNETPGYKNNNAQAEMVVDGVNGNICNSVTSTVRVLKDIEERGGTGMLEAARDQFVKGYFSSALCYEHVLASIGVEAGYKCFGDNVDSSERISNYLANYKDRYTQPRVEFGKYFFSDIQCLVGELLWKIERKRTVGRG